MPTNAVDLLQKDLDAEGHEILNVVPTVAGSATHTDNTTPPADVGGTADPGSSLLAAPADHVHEGVHGIGVDGDAVAVGDINLVSSASVTVERTGQDISFTVEFPPVEIPTGTLNKISLAEDAAGYVKGTTEAILREWYVNFDDCGASSIVARLAAIAKVTATTTGTYNLRVGATAPGAVAGSTVRATFTSTSATEELKTNAGAAFANPTGLKLVQLTAINSGAAGKSYARGITVSIG